MVELTTIAEVDSELAQTADWKATRDIAKARRRHAALTRKLDFPQATARKGQSIAFALELIQKQIESIDAFLAANEELTEADQLRFASVIHADFSTFRGYQ